MESSIGSLAQGKEKTDHAGDVASMTPITSEVDPASSRFHDRMKAPLLEVETSPRHFRILSDVCYVLFVF